MAAKKSSSVNVKELILQKGERVGFIAAAALLLFFLGFGVYVASTSASSTIPRLRYIHKTEQVRRMPIGVTLVVDQAHIQDVERAFANSRLRFQNSQFHWQRFRGTLGGPEDSPGSYPGGPPLPGAPGSPRGEDDGRRSGRGLPSSGGSSDGGPSRGGPPGFVRPPGGLDRSAPPPGVPAFGGVLSNEQMPIDDGTANLVELSVYGIASIYERFPPKPTQPAEAGAAPGAGAPAPAGWPPPPAGSPAPGAGSPPPPPAAPKQ